MATTFNDQNDKSIFWQLIIEFAIGGGIKILFLIFTLIQYCLYHNVGRYLSANYKWTNTFFIKMMFNFILSINYGAFACVLKEWYYFFFFNSLTWLIGCGFLYFEYIRKMPQSWLCLRLFWFINGLFYIAKLSFIFIHNFNQKKLLYFYLIQSIPSFFLMSFSVFKPNDSNNERDIEDNNLLCKLSKTNSFYNDDNLVTIAINEHKPMNYEMKDNMLIPITISNNDSRPENIRLKFNVKFKPNKNKKHIFKKTLFEIIQFNILIMEKFELINIDKEKKCTIMIQLKNITNIFMKHMNCSAKLKELESIYANLCKSYSFALVEFLKFCEVQDEKLRCALLDTFNHKLIDNNNNNNIRDTNDDIININNKNDNDFYSDLGNNKNNNRNHLMESNDIIKTSNYICGLINKENKLNLIIKTINEKPQLLESEIICTINSDITIKVPWNNLITLINHDTKINQTKTINSLIQIVKESKNITMIKKGQTDARHIIEKAFNEMINNLMYLDDVVYSIFDLNKLIKLDIEEIDMEIINSYFDLDIFSSCYNPKNSIYYSIPKCCIDSMEHVGKCDICEEKNAISIRMIVSVIIDENYDDDDDDDDKGNGKIKWSNNICLNELYEECIEIIFLNGTFQRFKSLTYLLKSITDTINIIIKKYKPKKNKNTLSNSLIKDKDNDYKEEWWNYLKELDTLMNQLLNKKHFYIFYSPYFRKSFGIDKFSNLMKKSNERNNNSDKNNNELNNSNNNNLNQSMTSNNNENMGGSYSNNNSFYENLIC